MKVISVISQKGGCGKTTIAVNMAVELSRRGYRVHLLDIDHKQRSAITWSTHSQGKYLDVSGVPIASVANQIKRQADSYDYFIVDCPPRADEEAAMVINFSDFLLIPIQPSPYDVWATGELIGLIQTKAELTKSPHYPEGYPMARIVFSEVIEDTNMVKDVTDVMENAKIPILTAYTTHYDAYKRSALEGKTLYDCKAVNKKAIQQISNITDEVLETINNERS